MLDAWDGDRRTGWGILSPTQQQMWRTLDAGKSQSGQHYIATLSENEMARKTGLSRRTIQRNVDAMVAKHAIEIWQAGSRDHSATIYRLVEYRECLKRCAEDPAIGVRLVHGVPHFFVWSHGRRLMSENELGPEGWRIDLTPAAVPVERRENPGGGLAPPQTGVASDVSLRPAESQSAPPLGEVLELFRSIRGCEMVHPDCARNAIASVAKILGAPASIADFERMIALVMIGRPSGFVPGAAYLEKCLSEKAEVLREVREGEARSRRERAASEERQLEEIAVSAWLVYLDHGSGREAKAEAADMLRTFDGQNAAIRERAKAIATERLYGRRSNT